MIESALSVTYWLPFYYVFKFALIMWLGLPQFGYSSPRCSPQACGVLVVLSCILMLTIGSLKIVALSLSSARSSSLSLPSNLLAAPTLRPPTSVQRLMLPLVIRHCKRPNNRVLILMQCKAADMTHAHEDTMVSYWVYVLLGYSYGQKPT